MTVVPVPVPAPAPAAITFQPLGPALLPDVVPDNGAQHGFATILESLGSGLGVLDIDHDGREDLVIAGGGDLQGRQVRGLPLRALRCGDRGFTDVTAASQPESCSLYSHGLAVSDFNNDGFADFLLTGYGGIRLYQNCGDGTFADVTLQTQLEAPTWNASAAWGDLNHDGYADLYVTGYVNWSFENDPPCYAADGTTRDNCSPKLFSAVPDSLFLSQGDGTFHNATQEWGVRNDGKALGVIIADLDQDRFPDVYVGNDVMMNFLYRNQGGHGFADASISSGAGVSSRGSPDASMGVEAADFNLDGRPDLWAANFEMESFALYQNQGAMLFRHISEATGVAALGDQFVGWGSVFADFDNDGDEDISVCNGNVVQYPTHSPWLQRMVVMENREGEYFADVTAAASPDMLTPRHGRGLVSLDWNQDGRPDLAMSPIHSRSELYQNTSATSEHWLCVELCGVISARHPVGAVAVLETNARRRIRLQKGGGSYLSSSSPILHFGYPAAETPVRLIVQWPSGTDTVIEAPAGNRLLRIIEARP
ncbi:MAG: CRTAC1 family protein [Planctomycetota bacterium]